AFPMLDVKVLGEADAVELLLRGAVEGRPREEFRIATTICRTLGRLPLAIALAAAYLAKHPRVTPEGSLRGIVKQGGMVVTEGGGVDAGVLPTQHEKAVRATLEEQWQAVRAEGDGRRVLMTAALLGEAVQVPRARLSLLTGLADQPEDWRDAP